MVDTQCGTAGCSGRLPITGSHGTGNGMYTYVTCECCGGRARILFDGGQPFVAMLQEPEDA